MAIEFRNWKAACDLPPRLVPVASLSRHGSFLIDVDPTEDERERIGYQLMTVAYSLAHYLNSTTDAEVPDGLKRWCMGDEGDPFPEEGGAS